MLKKYAIDIGDDGWDEKYGYGLVNFEEAKFCEENINCDTYGVFENNFPVADPRKFNAVMMTAEKYDRDITITAKDGYNFLVCILGIHDLILGPFWLNRIFRQGK